MNDDMNKRQQFKLGRRSPKRAPSLRLNRFLKGALVPNHPPRVDYAASLSNWQMLGNDQYGDCVAVAWANFTRLITSYLSTEEYPSMSEVIDVYKTQNPNFPADDNGMDVQTLLEYLHSNGGPDGRKPVAFASVNYNDPAEVEAAQAIFGGVILGFLVYQNNMNEFDMGMPWSYDASQPTLGGHAVLMGGYDENSGYKFVTWAQETSMDLSFINSPAIEEAWVMIFPEHLGSKEFMDGIDINALAADYKALTGQDLPIPAPAPTPVPPPVPTPPPAPQPLPSWLQAIVSFIESIIKLIFG